MNKTAELLAMIDQLHSQKTLSNEHVSVSVQFLRDLANEVGDRGEITLAQVRQAFVRLERMLPAWDQVEAKLELETQRAARLERENADLRKQAERAERLLGQAQAHLESVLPEVARMEARLSELDDRPDE